MSLSSVHNTPTDRTCMLSRTECSHLCRTVCFARLHESGNAKRSQNADHDLLKSDCVTKSAQRGAGASGQMLAVQITAVFEVAGWATELPTAKRRQQAAQSRTVRAQTAIFSACRQQVLQACWMLQCEPGLGKCKLLPTGKASQNMHPAV